MDKKSRTKRRFLAMSMGIIIVACFLVLPFFSSVESQATETKERVRVGFVSEPMLHQVDDNGNHQGYGPEYLKLLAQYTDWEYEFVEGTWDQCLQRIQTGDIDLLGFVIYSTQRQAMLNYSATAAGYIPICLYARVDNDALELNDYPSFDGKKVGVLKGSSPVTGFVQCQLQNNIHFQMVEYDSGREIQQAIRSGAVDLGIYPSVNTPKGLKVVEKFNDEPFYYGVTKQKPALLKELNDAMNQILSTDMDFNDDLNEKYFRKEEPRALILTEKEKQYIAEKQVLRVVYDRDFYPLERYDKKTQQYEGISKDLLSEICERVGLTFEVVPTKDYTQALEFVQDGKADLVTCVSTSYVLDQGGRYWMTRPYVDAPMVYVQNQRSRGQIQTLALPKSYYIEENLQEANPHAKIVHYDSVKQCLDAVVRGKADATFSNFYVATHILSDSKYHDLESIAAYDLAEELGMGISRTQDPLLLSIINKGIQSISDERMDTIVSKHTFRQVNPSALDILYTNPLLVAGLFVGVASIVILVLLIFVYNKQQAKSKLERMYYYDEITNHGNYNWFLESAKKIQVRNENRWYAVVYMDMVDFKFINDTYGYEEGDKILGEVASLLGNFVGEEEEYARMYADHFVMLLKFDRLDGFDVRMDDLSARLEQLSGQDERSYSFLFHGGVYIFQQGELPINIAVDYANYAKKTVPRTHENTYVYYNNEIKNQILKEKELELMMKEALGREQFVPYFQPKVNVYTGELVGAEALVRWIHPQKGLIQPGEFIPYFEKNGFVIKLDLYMYEEVCKRLRAWLDAGKKVFPISCNMSYLHVINPAFPKMMQELVDRYDVPSYLLELELTETVAVNNVEVVTQCGNALLEHGFTVSIDDFGSGYSSISLLQKIPVHVLKLDKEFVQTGACGEFQKDLVECLVTAVMKNNIAVVCEGVETREQEDFIKEIGCQFAQGYRYYKPMPDYELEKLLK